MFEVKCLVVEKVIEYVEDGMIVGVGIGFIVVYFIDVLVCIQYCIKGVVFSFEQSIVCLKQYGIEVIELNYSGNLLLYVDGVDECDLNKCLIKGGGVVLICEKIIVEVSECFICIVDLSKQVLVLGRFLLLVEVILMVCSLVVCQICDMIGGQLIWCEGVVIDNGNQILDIYNLQIIDLEKLECEFNQLLGVVCVGLFVCCCVDVVIVGGELLVVF